MPPTLETARLRLRPHRVQDLADCAAMWADPIVVRYFGGQGLTREEVWARMLRYTGHWAWMGFGYWAVEEKETRRFVGDVGFADFKRNMEPSIEGTPEIGWVLASSMHGKGYATEAVTAATAWGDLYLGTTETACIIHPDNQPSLRVAEKCGYIQTGQATYRNQPLHLLTRQRP